MIPSKIEVLRRYYTLEVKEVIDYIANALNDLPIVDLMAPFTQLRVIVELNNYLEEGAQYMVTSELKEAGWGCTFYNRDSANTNVIIFPL